MSVIIRLVKKEDVTPAQLERMTDVLTDAFLTYQEHVDLWSDDRILNRTLCKSAITHNLNKHYVWVAEKEKGGEIVAVALWNAPGEVWFTEEDIPAVFGEVMALLEPIMLEWFIGVMLPGQEEMSHSVAPNSSRDWWMADMLGVEQSMQGQGVGSKLLQATREYAQGAPMALYTQSAKNVKFYEKNGFAVRAERDYEMPNGKSWLDRYMSCPGDASTQS